MAANLTTALQQQGFIPLDIEYMEILDVLLPSQVPQISPCPIDWDIYFKSTPQQLEASLSLKRTSLSSQNFLKSLQQQTKEECVSILSQALCDITADVLALAVNEK